MCLRDLRQDREKESNPARPGVRTCGAGRTSALQTARLIADGDHPGKSNLADSPPRPVGLDLVGEPVGDPLHIIVRQDRPGTHLDQPAKPGALALGELAQPRRTRSIVSVKPALPSSIAMTSRYPTPCAATALRGRGEDHKARTSSTSPASNIVVTRRLIRS